MTIKVEIMQHRDLKLSSPYKCNCQLALYQLFQNVAYSLRLIQMLQSEQTGFLSQQLWFCIPEQESRPQPNHYLPDQQTQGLTFSFGSLFWEWFLSWERAPTNWYLPSHPEVFKFWSDTLRKPWPDLSETEEKNIAVFCIKIFLSFCCFVLF